MNLRWGRDPHPACGVCLANLPQEKMARDQLVFYLNGKRVELNDADPETTLIQFVRSIGALAPSAVAVDSS